MFASSIILVNLHSCATHTKKCGAHTHAHYLSQLSSSIFTSVVVYSRTSNKQLEPTQTRVVLLIARVLCVGRVRFMTNDLIKTKKKCGAHTHVHHLSQLSSPIFTSVVVYSRTSNSILSSITKVVFVLRGYLKNHLCFATSFNI